MENPSPRAGRSSFAPIQFVALAAIIVGAALFRLFPHPPNFTPITGLALFGGARMTSPTRRGAAFWAFLVPFAALLLSDACLGFYPEMVAVYVAFAFIVLMGFTLRRHATVARMAGVTLASSLLFFAISNFGVWALTSFYPQNGAGFVECYLAGLPFLRNTVLGDVISTGALFGLWAALQNYVPKLRASARISEAA